TFTIGDDGALWTTWKSHGSVWRPPLRISPTNLAPPSATAAGVFYPVGNQVEVFFVGNDGTLWDVWKANNGNWQPPGRLSAANFAPAGGHVAAAYQPLFNQ